MTVEVIAVPWDSGHRAVRMGRGPLHLLEAGLEDALRDDGHATRITSIDSGLELDTEVASAFDLARSIARAVDAARARGDFPLVLAGNCFSALGTVAGLGCDRTGVLWLDAHGDLNTPETTRSGFLDGMAVAALTGRCWTGLAGTLPGFRPVPDRHVLFLGARDLDPAETDLIGPGRLPLVSADALTGDRARGAAGDIDRIAGEVTGFYLHVDLDVLDPAVARANGHAAPGGLDTADVVAIAEIAASVGSLAGAAITAYDPALDDDGRAADAALTIARAAARLARPPT